MFSPLKKISTFVIGGFESFFFWYGKLVATSPWWAILACFLISGLCAIGLIGYRTENNAFKLWIPDDSEFLRNYQFLQENFPPDTRFNNLILSADDVLDPKVIKLLYSLHKDVETIRTKDGKGWQDLCKTLPTISPFKGAVSSPKAVNCSNVPESFSEIMCDIPRYCDFIEMLSNEVCFETGILELWGYEDKFYETLTKEEILKVVNGPLFSKPFNRPIESLDTYLNVTTEAGLIVSAKALSMSWFGSVNYTLVTDQDVSNSGAGLPVDKITFEFEGLLKEKLEEYQSKFEDLGVNAKLFINVARSYEDVAGETILNDAMLMPVGFMMVFIYIMIMLGKFDCINTRAFLASVGLGSIGLTILVTYGLCSGFGLFFGPMHNVIPFLFLGIGIDDMFVIMQCFDNLHPSEKEFGNNPHNIGMAMKHAGVAITVTSLTDVVVFGVGATTVLPSLRSFCLYCAVGMTAVYFFQATFFVACLALDQRRIDQNRNGLLPCFKHNLKREKEENDKSDNENSFTGKLFGKFGSLLVNPFVTVLVLAVTATFAGIGIWGVTMLETRFEAIWFLPPDSYLVKWFDASGSYFPNDGVQVTVYVTDLKYNEEISKVAELYSAFNKSTEIIKSVNSFYPDMERFFNDNIGLADDGGGIPTEILPIGMFNNYTSLFLYSKDGSRYRPNFYTDPKSVDCGGSFDKLEMTTFAFTHKPFDGPSEHIPAMKKVKELILEQEFSSNVFALAQEYSNWETDEVIDYELYRNLGLSMACVFVATLILLADFIGSSMVMLCVLMTLVDVMGFMHFWDITIDVVSSIVVIISIGLCVDYASHIAHTFLSSQGTRRERSVYTVQSIGPAVLNGGFSTFLALVLLATSKSHVFSVFFKVFFLVVTFGLFHGLVFLPVLLSLIGPSSYQLKKVEKPVTITEKESTTKF